MDSEAKQIAHQLAKRLTTIRLQRAWTRETLAEHSGVNVYTLKRFERTGQISLERLVLLCSALDVCDELIRLFKPRQRINVDEWKAQTRPVRQRGKRKAAVPA